MLIVDWQECSTMGQFCHKIYSNFDGLILIFAIYSNLDDLILIMMI